MADQTKTKIVLLFIGPEFFGAFGSESAAVTFAGEAKAKNLYLAGETFRTETRVYTKAELENLLQGDVSDVDWRALMFGEHTGRIKES